MSATTCPVFQPTLEEFSNFSRYISQIEKQIRKKYGSENVGICKVIPPEGWYQPYYDPQAADEEALLAILDKLDYLKILPVKQCPNGARGNYQLALTELKKLTPREFYLKSKKSTVEDGLDDKEVEKRFWKSLGPMCEAPMYGADLKGTLFGDEPASGWNLNRLDNMIKLLPSTLPGVTSSMLYFGMWRAMFAWHTEDVNLYSINYLHMGKPKSWYSVPPKHARRIESVAMVHFADGFRTCKEFMRHKTTMISPKALAESGIPIHMVVQQPGEFVITFPDSYHAGFNHGFNVAEATNFTTESWIKEGLQARVCRCQPYSVHINMEFFQCMLALKKAEDKENVKQVAKSREERKHMLRMKMFEGWLAWQEREEAREKAERAERRKKRTEARVQQEKKRKEREEAMLLVKEVPSQAEQGAGDNDAVQPPDLKRLREAGAPPGFPPAENEEWNFECSCGVRCNSEDPLELQPVGAMFQCSGCLSWCHTYCLYGDEVVPPLAFCHRCHFAMLRLKKINKAEPPVRGDKVKIKSRVVVLETIKGIAEGRVIDLSPDGKEARVHFTLSGKKGLGMTDEWIPKDSQRFLSNESLEGALEGMKRRLLGGLHAKVKQEKRSLPPSGGGMAPGSSSQGGHGPSPPCPHWSNTAPTPGSNLYQASQACLFTTGQRSSQPGPTTAAPGGGVGFWSLSRYAVTDPSGKAKAATLSSSSSSLSASSSSSSSSTSSSQVPPL